VSAAGLLGLAAFVAVFTTAGLGVLVALEGTPHLRSVVLDLGLAYLLGVVSLGSVLTLAVLAGVPFSVTTMLVGAAVFALGGVLVGRARGRREEIEGPRAGRYGYLVAAGLLALVLVVVEAYFRAGRLHGLFGFDAGAFWTPKAAALHAAGEFDEAHFASFPAPSYPPLVPMLQAAFFELRGEVDLVGLHLVYWSWLAGFVAASARLLLRVANPVLVWGMLLLLLVAGQAKKDALTPQADLFQDVVLGLGVLFVARWLADRRTSSLVGALLFVSALALVKREGYLFAACVAGAVLLACGLRTRSSWGHAALFALLPVAVALPWRVWFTRRSLVGDGPDVGVLDLADHADRVAPATWLVLRTLADVDVWPAVLVVALAAAVGALLAGERTLPVFTLSLLGLTAVGYVWTMWAFTSLPITQDNSQNPITRLVGGALVPAALLSPILLQRVLDATGWEAPRAPTHRLRVAAVAAVAAVAVAYPVGVLALEGAPRFPSRADCAALAAPDATEFVLVYDHRSWLPTARAVRDRLAEVGFADAEVRADGCGGWEVVNPGVQTLEQARGHIEDARRVGFEPRLEER
jgi:hypothetical protein